MPIVLTDADACADAIVERVGPDLRLATPLGAGKPNHLLNALYRRVKSDPSLTLTIMTALTLQRPTGKSDLERRFLGPFAERVFGDYPDLDYELDRVAGKLPANVRVVEFYFPAGKFLHNAQAQRDYISTNYTHVARDVLDRGVNVLAQQVAEGTVDGEERFSLSSNPDVTPDLLAALGERPDAAKAVAVVAQVNRYAPFMYGDAVVEPEAFDLVLRNPELDHELFGAPKMSISDVDAMIGLHASALVKDGGELQIGIGALGDALVYALKLREQENDAYNAVLEALDVLPRNAEVIARKGDTGRFSTGLFAATEMVVDGFLELMTCGIVKRRVYDHVGIQRLLNQGVIGDEVTPATLDALLAARAIHPRLNQAEFEQLRHFGVFRPTLRYDDGELVFDDGTRVAANLDDVGTRRAIVDRGLGARLLNGAVIHGGFFLGPRAFYRALRRMTPEDRRLISMRSVTKINQLYGHEQIDRLHRKNARFINTGMMVTLGGAVVSDGLADGRVVSGVGGQYNFVAMAHALPDGHSILQIRSTRTTAEGPASNVVFNYGHITIPRHLRDIVITEYGIADIRGKTDEEVAMELLKITDSRFQEELVQQAKAVGKLRPEYETPDAYRHNLPETYGKQLAKLRQRGLFPPFPFGCDFDDLEITVGRALRSLKSKAASTGGTLLSIARTLTDPRPDPDLHPYLERMGLSDPQTMTERLYRRLLAHELREQLDSGD